jgi:hypothetical protein
MKANLASDVASWKTTMPASATPTAPMPTQTAYAVPTGRLRSAAASSTKLAVAATTTISVGTRREKPSACFSATAQTISRRPARMRKVQAIRGLLGFVRVGGGGSGTAVRRRTRRRP